MSNWIPAFAGMIGYAGMTGPPGMTAEAVITGLVTMADSLVMTDEYQRLCFLRKVRRCQIKIKNSTHGI